MCTEGASFWCDATALPPKLKFNQPVLFSSFHLAGHHRSHIADFFNPDELLKIKFDLKKKRSGGG